MQWFELPAYYRRNREALLAANDHFIFRGYAQIARRFFLRPVFHPIHPYL
jgi:hypothetical protein